MRSIFMATCLPPPVVSSARQTQLKAPLPISSRRRNRESPTRRLPSSTVAPGAGGAPCQPCNDVARLVSAVPTPRGATSESRLLAPATGAGACDGRRMAPGGAPAAWPSLPSPSLPSPSLASVWLPGPSLGSEAVWLPGLSPDATSLSPSPCLLGDPSVSAPLLGAPSVMGGPKRLQLGESIGSRFCAVPTSSSYSTVILTGDPISQSMTLASNHVSSASTPCEASSSALVLLSTCTASPTSGSG
mmetsp:Transcript_1216/g.3290  ORF Transcript_1216/g.3290 Transcript_1216/m.3290 type:complete len:245 (+) Transcript_1216:930-1664(+)